MLKIKHKKVFLSTLLLSIISDSAFATSPNHLIDLDLGNNKGKLVGCEVYITHIDDISGCSKNNNTHNCPNVSIYTCPVFNKIDEVICNYSKMDEEYVEKYNSMQSTEIDKNKIAQELVIKGKAKVHNKEIKNIEASDIDQNILFAEIKRLKIPKARITGILGRCVRRQGIPANPLVGLSDICMLSACEIQLIDKDK